MFEINVVKCKLTNEGLEPGALTSTGLFLDRHDLQHLILQGGPNEGVNDLKLLDGQREKVDLLQRLDLSIFDQTAQLCDWNPLLLSFLSTTTSTGSTASSSTTTSSTTTTSTETSATTTGWSCVRHSAEDKNRQNTWTT